MIRFFKYISLQSRLEIVRWLMMSLSVLSLTLSACTPRGHGGDDTATFDITNDVDAKSEISRLSPGFGIPTARRYTFKVCLQNRRSQEKIRRLAPFEIIGGAKTIDGQTDDGGCLNWSEEIPYNHLADERYLTIERVVRATGMEAGSRRIRLAINPWLISKGPPYIDIERTKTIPTQTLSPQASVSYVQLPAEGGRPLSVSGLIIENAPIQSATSIIRKLRISFHPVVLTNDMYGQPAPFPLPKANLTASVRLIVINAVAGEDRASEVSGQNDIPVIADGDFFRFDFTPRIQNANRNSRFQLAIQLNPVNGPKDLLPYKSLYAIGDFVTLTSAPTLPAILRDRDYSQSPDVPANLPIQSANPQTNQNLVSAHSGIRAAAPFEVGEIKAELHGIQAENALIRKVLYIGTTCITDLSNGGRPAVDEDFKIEIGEGSAKRTLQMTERLGPGNEGCYFWEDSIPHRYYEPEKFYHLPIKIKHFQSGFSTSRVIGINPWDRFLFARDTNIASSTIQALNSRKPIPSRLTTDSIGLETVAPRKYSVDEFMELRMLKTVQVRVPMRVERFSNMVNGRSLPPEVLRKGIWGFRAMIYMRGKHFTGEEFEKFIPMEGDYQLTSSQAGDIKARIDIDISDARLFRMRSLIVFEIVPIDESKLNPQELATLSLDPDHKYEDVIEHESMIVAPTFSAPIWVGQEVMNRVPFPTDILIAGGRPADDDARHLQGATYDQLLKRGREIEEKRLRNARISQSLVGYLKNANLDYVSLHNEKQIQDQNPGLSTLNKGFPSTDAAKTLLGYLNFKFPQSAIQQFYTGFRLNKPVTTGDVRAFIEGRHDLNQPLAGHICMALIHQIAAPALARPGDAFKACLRDVAADFLPGGKSGASVFAIDHALRILETDGGVEVPTNQPAIGFSVGADSVLMRSESAAGQVAISVAPSVIVSKFPFLELFSGTLGGGYSWNKSASEGGTIASNQQLAMETVELDVTAKRYEACTAIRLRSRFWDDRPQLLHKAKLSGADLKARLTRGLYICTGIEDKTPRKVREKFFTFTQPIHDGVRRDPGDLSSYPFLVSVRGANDYVRLIELLRLNPNLKAATLWDALNLKGPVSNVPDNFDLVGFPLGRLNDAFRAYNSRLPAQPGTYVYQESNKIIPEPAPDENQPWWSRFATQPTL